MTDSKKKNLEESYDRIINVGLCIVPYEDLTDITAPEVMLFGTTKDEKLFSFRELDAMFKSQYEQMDGFVPSLDRKRLFTRTSNDGNNAFISEEVILTITSPEEVNTIFIRCSCVMEYIDNQWKLTHWHASTPVDTENDHWHMEEWKREKEKLQNLVDQQTADLQGKNRELEIEAAIERVRVVAMGMTQPDDMLDVCRVISDQLQQFGVEHIRNVQTVIVNEEKGTYHNYQYFSAYDKESFEITESDKNPVVQEMITRMLESPDAFFTTSLTGAELATFRSYRKKENQFPDPLLDDTKSLDGYFFSIGPGGLGITLYRPLNEKGLEIFKRFHNVFSLAYRRFRDIEQAEAQAREAQIELSLERIRAQATAMKESSDLLDIVVTMRTEFVNLGHEAHYFWHMRWLPDRYDKAMTSGDGSRIGMVMTLPRHIHGDIEPVAEWEKGDDPTCVLAMDVETAVEYVDKMISLGDFEQLDPQAPTLDDIRHIGGLTFIMARTTHGEIGYSLPGVVPEPPKDAVDTLVRFSAVFDLAYKRFEDLKAAERQHREAQIELALERVRARTMAMRNSDELAEASSLLFQQMEALGVHTYSSGFTIWDDKQGDLVSWMCNADGSMNPPFRMPVEEDKWHKEQYDRWKEGDDFIVKDLNGEEMKSYFRYLRSFPLLDKAFKTSESAGHLMPERQVHHVANFSQGNLLFITLDPVPEAHDIFKRFASVFDQTYTRFLDLKKAEAQARESEIQLALERVRARSMAMHQSDELADLSLELVKQVHALGIDTWFCAFNIYDDHPEGSIEWGSNGQGTFPRYRTPREGVFLDYYEAGQRGETLLINEIGEDECPSHYDYLCSLPGVGEQLLKIKDEGIPFPAYQIDHAAFFKYGYILFITFESVPEAHEIFKRFAKVFQQTYTRFLDLQKSEGQAREAKIEAALERVRARSMGMHKSDDLIDVVREIGKGIHELGIQLHYSQIYTDYTYDPKTELNIWVDVESQDYLEKFHLPYIDHSITLNYYNALNEGLDYFGDRYSKAEKDTYFKLLFKYSDLKRIPKKRKELILNATGWTRFTVILTEATLNFGRYSLDEFTDEEHEIFIRFAKVFGQAYTRFLDLKKAEEQVREAEIQLALERVRAKTMAMKTQSDLFGVVEMFGEQLDAVGVRFDDVTIIDGPITKDRDWDLWSHIPGEDGFTRKVHIPYIDTPYFTKTAEAVEEYEKTGNPIQVKSFTKSEKNEFLDHYFKHAPAIPNEVTKSIYANPGSVIVDAFLKEVTVSLVRSDLEPYTDEELEIFERFSKEFRQTYIRFLDLQKSEKQAREAQIEAALERVRSRSLAMQKTNELQDVVRVVAEELKNTGVILDTGGAVICTYFQDSRDVIHWTATDDPAHPSVPYLLPYFEDELFDEAWESKSRGDDYFAKVFSYNVKNAFFSYAFEHSDYRQLPDEYKKIILESKSHGLAWAWAENSAIMIPSIQGDLPSEEEKKTLIRFAKVFEQSFIRFLDLQKAEAQAREAEIEAALERVRSRSMGMQKSSDLRSVVDTLYGEFKRLGLIFDNVVIQLLLDDTKDLHMWITSEDGLYEDIIHWPYVDLPVFHEFYEARIGNKSINYRTSSEAETIEFFEEYFKLDAAPQERKSATKQVKSINNMGTYQEHTGIFLMRYTEGEYSEKDHEIVRRFSKVFEQTYTRFLDLKKAEKQARESRIEAALERVRSRAMAMQSSDELKEVANELRTQMGLLGQKDLEVCAIHLYDLHEDHFESWGAMHPPGSEGEILQSMALIPKSGSLIIDEMMDLYASGQTDYVLVNEGEKFKQWFELMKEHAPEIYRHLSKAKADTPADKIKAYWSMSEFSGGALIMVTYSYPDEDSRNLLRKTANVFGLAYKRFNDLKRAEEQAREAQIENALEKVRSRSLAMQHPDELTDVAQLLREEMGALGVEELETSSIYIHDDTNGLTQCWFTIKDSDDPGKSVTDQMMIDLQDTLVGRQMDKFYQSDQDSTSILMKGGQRIEWIRYCEAKSDLFGKSEFYGESIPERTYHLYKFSNGFLGAASPGEISDESWDLMRRATGVFSFAYTRFSDLQKAEESARRARQQASLDRVRADISGMRSAKDLNRVTPLIWNELTTLGIPFIRCGVFIMHEDDELVEVYLSKPDGTSLAVMRLPFGSNELVTQTLNAWQQGSVYTQHWTREEFLEWGRSMMEQGQVPDLESYQGAEEAPESLHLQFLPFNQGMLYVGSINPLDDEEISLSESLAKAFSIAYARYEDFVKLEKAKTGIEEALTELKATQSQLVQQEKLASLGQLTAGIAHEIKNPLNFVNNFSDLSVELIQEAREEVKRQKAKGKSKKESPLEGGTGVPDGTEVGDDAISANDSNPSLLLDILDDIETNLKTIHKHGSRADSIVKSMLQHSRGGDGKMEPTPLNPIIKEYVNLAFHGMRAGKDPINVDIDLQLDENVGEVSLVAEDFSRVILNLVNNAFYAMREKEKLTGDGGLKTGKKSPFEGGKDGKAGQGDDAEPKYSPKLSIRTKSSSNSVTLEIEDNGPGIPDEIKDKIMQPFFTTKKGTAGTGLGLSITNDIIKAHGGDLEIFSEIEKGTTFLITLKT